MRTIILLALIGAAFGLPKVPKSIQRIVGGVETNVETYPFMANMEHFYWWGRWAHVCGGTLISSNSIISAAHCFEDDPASVWRARLGSSFRSEGGTTYTASDIIRHPLFVYELFMHDIAIVRLSTNVVFSNTVGAARVGGRNYIPPDGTEVTTAGWGGLYHGGFYSEELLHVSLKIFNQQECASRYAYLKTRPGYEHWPDVTDDTLCAGLPQGGGVCQGDSGGPLLHQRDVLVGVVSWGFDCGHDYWPPVFSRVSYNVDWIISNT